MVTRREFLAVAGATAAGSALIKVATPSSLAALPRAKPDFTIRIAPVNLELAPGAVIKTIGYNGKAPGPILRMREGKRVTVDIHNDTDSPELVHWHGQFVSPEVDGTEEEGSPLVAPHTNRQFTFVPQPSGTRWYHTHAMAGPEDRKSTRLNSSHVQPSRMPSSA